MFIRFDCDRGAIKEISWTAMMENMIWILEFSKFLKLPFIKMKENLLFLVVLKVSKVKVRQSIKKKALKPDFSF